MRFEIYNMFIDVVIIILVILSCYIGYRRGFIVGLYDLLGIIVSLLIGVIYFKVAGRWLSHTINLPITIASTGGFIILILLINTLWNIFASYFNRLYPYSVRNSRYNKLLGIPIGIIYILTFIGIFGWLVLRYPVYPKLIQSSRLLTLISKPFNLPFKEIGNNLDQTIKSVAEVYLSSPEIEEFKKIDISYAELKEDEQSELKMLALINEERERVGLDKLKLQDNLQQLARKYAKEMWQKQFFSHSNPEGLTIYDRLKKNNIKYIMAGENLALAPTVNLAHKGFMDSPPHKKNIMDPNFQHAGIGAISNGKNSIMFVQLFSN